MKFVLHTDGSSRILHLGSTLKGKLIFPNGIERLPLSIRGGLTEYGMSDAKLWEFIYRKVKVGIQFFCWKAKRPETHLLISCKKHFLNNKVGLSRWFHSETLLCRFSPVLVSVSLNHTHQVLPREFTNRKS